MIARAVEFVPCVQDEAEPLGETQRRSDPECEPSAFRADLGG